jgi:hypothetical protein
MADTFWYKQGEKPLFEEILWSRPERRDQAGKLLIIGGSKQGFALAASAYQAALTAGVGRARLILPSSLHNLPVFQSIPDVVFAKNTSTGALGNDSWEEIAAGLSWADWTLITGDTGHNPETAQLIQRITESKVPLTIASTATEVIMTDTASLAQRQQTLLILEFNVLQKFFIRTGGSQALTSDMGLVKLVEILHGFTGSKGVSIVTKLENHILVASGGKISSTKSNLRPDELSAKMSVFALQNKNKLFEALTTTILA